MAQAMGTKRGLAAPGGGERARRHYLSPRSRGFANAPSPHGSRHGLLSCALRALISAIAEVSRDSPPYFFGAIDALEFSTRSITANRPLPSNRSFVNAL